MHQYVRPAMQNKTLIPNQCQSVCSGIMFSLECIGRGSTVHNQGGSGPGREFNAPMAAKEWGWVGR